MEEVEAQIINCAFISKEGEMRTRGGIYMFGS